MILTVFSGLGIMASARRTEMRSTVGTAEAVPRFATHMSTPINGPDHFVHQGGITVERLDELRTGLETEMLDAVRARIDLPGKPAEPATEAADSPAQNRPTREIDLDAPRRGLSTAGLGM